MTQSDAERRANEKLAAYLASPEYLEDEARSIEADKAERADSARWRWLHAADTTENRSH